MTCSVKQYYGDCREVLKGMAEESVDCCVTSPPYFGLRDYGTASWIGGDPDCSHRVGNQVQYSKWSGAISHGIRPGTDASKCVLCGAKRKDSQIGIEATPEEYVFSIIEAFKGVRRVLKAEGTVWLNLGDSYATGTTAVRQEGKMSLGEGTEKSRAIRRIGTPDGLKTKDLIGIPWRVALALQMDGWYLRQDIIWSKPNPMPESVKDRCTKSHEYMFLLSKSQRYFFDADAIKEKAIGGTPGNKTHKGKTAYLCGDDKMRTKHGLCDIGAVEFRNRRSVWTIPTKPYSGAHFAVFPEKLIEPCILAGCPEGGVVLDPFGGSGTTARVAIKNNRKAVLIELNKEYIELQNKRTSHVQLNLIQGC